MSTDPHNELRPEQAHYIGIDVGTGSARACIMNDKGDIVGLASENIGLWQPESGYYVSLTLKRDCLRGINLIDRTSRSNLLPTYGDVSVHLCSVQ